jgi:hypothetical protein
LADCLRKSSRELSHEPATNSPSPWGEGWDEGGGQTNPSRDGPAWFPNSWNLRHLVRDLAGFIRRSNANFEMSKTKPARRISLQPLETGQIWRVAGLNFQVGLIGKWLVHYKLSKPNAVRVANSVGGRSTIEKYLKKNKAVLVKALK